MTQKRISTTEGISADAPEGVFFGGALPIAAITIGRVPRVVRHVGTRTLFETSVLSKAYKTPLTL
ncbi:MAG: hypothetical protein WBB25_21045 [Sulfitobacter sp.]